jgi:hypothetical protein
LAIFRLTFSPLDKVYRLCLQAMLFLGGAVVNFKLRLVLIKEEWDITCLSTFDFLVPFLMQYTEFVSLENFRVTKIGLWGTGLD